MLLTLREKFQVRARDERLSMIGGLGLALDFARDGTIRRHQRAAWSQDHQAGWPCQPKVALPRGKPAGPILRNHVGVAGAARSRERKRHQDNEHAEH